jgi:hypothetical protein
MQWKAKNSPRIYIQVRIAKPHFTDDDYHWLDRLYG